MKGRLVNIFLFSILWPTCIISASFITTLCSVCSSRQHSTHRLCSRQHWLTESSEKKLPQFLFPRTSPWCFSCTKFDGVCKIIVNLDHILYYQGRVGGVGGERERIINWLWLTNYQLSKKEQHLKHLLQAVHKKGFHQVLKSKCKHEKEDRYICQLGP